MSPFKTEKTPSFIVSPDKNIWHDFSSGKGGDVITFVMEMEGLSFPEALEMLAKRAGIKLKPRKIGDGYNTNIKNKLYDASESAMAYYHRVLSKDTLAKDYFMVTRGLSEKTIKDYKLGYSQDSWDSLTNYLVKKGFSHQELVTAGLAAKSPRGSGVYDLFRGRVMFPVFDAQGRVVGFSARLLVEQKAAKYINTPQTPIYNKSSAIYGLTQAKESIRQQDGVVIVEGNMDVLALANAGHTNVVACSGTALSETQIRQLSRLTKNITLCFDSDEAGINATLRAIDLSGNSEVKVDIISLKGAKDPDEFLKSNPLGWQKALKLAQYAPDYLMAMGKSKYNILSASGKKQFVGFILPMLKNLSDEIEIQHYIKKIAQMVDVDELSIKKLIKFTAPAMPLPEDTTAQDDSLNQPKRQLTRSEKLEQQLLELCLAYPITTPALDDLELSSVSNLHHSIFKLLKTNGPLKSLDSMKVLPKEENYVKILALRGEQQYANLSAHDIRLEAFTQVARIHDTNRQLLKRQLARQLSEAESAGDSKKSKQLLREYQLLLNED